MVARTAPYAYGIVCPRCPHDARRDPGDGWWGGVSLEDTPNELWFGSSDYDKWNTAMNLCKLRWSHPCELERRCHLEGECFEAKEAEIE